MITLKAHIITLDTQDKDLKNVDILNLYDLNEPIRHSYEFMPNYLYKSNIISLPYSQFIKKIKGGLIINVKMIRLMPFSKTVSLINSKFQLYTTLIINDGQGTKELYPGTANYEIGMMRDEHYKFIINSNTSIILERCYTNTKIKVKIYE